MVDYHLKINYSKFFAANKGIYSDAGNAITNGNSSQAGAFIEGSIPDAGDAVRNRNARQVAATLKGPLPDAGNAITMVTLVRLLHI